MESTNNLGKKKMVRRGFYLLPVIVALLISFACCAESISPSVYKQFKQLDKDVREQQARTPPRFRLSRKGREALTNLNEKLAAEQLNTVESAWFLRMRGIIASEQGKPARALADIQRTIALNVFEKQEKRALLHNASILAYQAEKWHLSTKFMSNWAKAGGTLSTDDQALMANAYYELRDWPQAGRYISRAIKRFERKKAAPLSWYHMLASTQIERKQWKLAAETIKRILARDNSKDSWLRLAYLYSQANDDASLLSTLQLANQQSMLDQDGILWLVQLCADQNVPLRGAEVLSESLNNGRVKKNAQAYRKLAYAYYLAKEYQRASEALDAGLRVSPNNKDLMRFSEQLEQLLESRA